MKETCMNLENKLADANQHVIELEGRLRVLWDKLEGERKYYQDRINRLEEDYHDLIMQVERAFDGETRHQTAKRYIQNAEVIKLDSHEAKEAKP